MTGGVLLAMGCHSANVTTGHSAVTFLEPPPSTVAGEPAGAPEPSNNRSQYWEAEPIQPLTLPTYPAAALVARAGLATVAVHIVVDDQGRVSEIKPSFMAFTTGGPFAGDFRTAVEQAVRQWRFVPARIVKLENVKEAGVDYLRPTHQENTETEFDLSFTFDANGHVRQGSAK